MTSTPTSEVIAERYELIDVIGRGGQGQVWRARDLQTQTDVAVKMIEGRAARDPETIERMAREQQALVALAGTHAVGFLDMCTTDKGAVCLVMELLDGQDFEAYLVARENFGERLPVSKLVDVLTPIATTLIKAHSVGIIHRDLKPANIYLLSAKAGGGARLLDFGFARMTDSRRVTHTGMVMGSPSYIAPEMWKGQGFNADHRVDIYAFGVIVYRALSGELPFPNMSMQQTLVAVTTSKRPSLSQRRPDLPLRVDSWVERALAINTESRFPSIRMCWDHLLYSLEVGPYPEQAATGATTPPPEVDKIREWLEAPVATEPGQLGSVWSRASNALKRLVGASGPSPRLENMPLITPLAPAPMSPSGKPQAPKRLPAMPPPLRIAGLSPEPKRPTEPPVRAATQPPGSIPAVNPSPSTAPPLTAPPPRRIPTAPPIRIEKAAESSVVPLSSGSFVDLTEDAALAPKSERGAAEPPTPAEPAAQTGPIAPVEPVTTPEPVAPMEAIAATEPLTPAEPVASKPRPAVEAGAPSSRGKSPKSKRASSKQPSASAVVDEASKPQQPTSAKPTRLKPKWKSRRRRG